jgi:hypothetical protein
MMLEITPKIGIPLIKKDKFPSGRKCHECEGIGHIRANCGNLRKSKGKAFNVTQSDESKDDDSEEDEEVNVNYLAFTTYSNQYHIFGVQNVSNNEFDNEHDLQTAYNQMFQEFNKLSQQNKKNLKTLKEVETENENLVAKIRYLEKELNESKSHLNKFLSVQLDKMLNDQKLSHDRSGLGFGKLVSSKSNVAPT